MSTLKKIKIVHLVNNLGQDGTGKVVMDLCTFFGEEYDVSVISLSPNIELIKTKDWPKKVSVYPFNFCADRDYSLRRYLVLYFRQKVIREKSIEIIKRIEAIQPDILHCHLQPRELIIALQARLPNKTQLLFTDHSVRIKGGQYPFINTWILAWIYRKIYRSFHVVAVSKGVFECHKEFGLLNKKKIHVLIENKIETSRFTSSTKSTLPIRIVYVARLANRKGHDTLLDAWSKIRISEKIELVIVGGGELEKELNSMVKTFQPKHPVIFTGAVENVVPYLQSAHIGVFPSLQEGLPLSLLEKMSCGLPVIVSDIPEFQGIIEDGCNGIFFKTADSQDLCNKLEFMVNNSDVRERLGSNARKFVVENYDINGLEADYKRVYNRILNLP